MTPQELADAVIHALDLTVKSQKEEVDFVYKHSGTFDISLFGQATKILITHYRPKGWKNVEIGRVTMRDGCSFVTFTLHPGS